MILSHSVSSDLVQCLFVCKKVLLPLCEIFPQSREILEKVASMRHRNLHRMKRQTIGLWKKVNHFDDALRTIRAGGNRTDNKITSIDEANPKLEASYESCVVDFIESGPHNRYSPDRYAHSLTARRAKKDLSEPDPEQMISYRAKSAQYNMANIESCVFQSGIYAANPAEAKPVPKFLKESFANFRLRVKRPETQKKTEHLKDPKKLSGFFKLSNIFARKSQVEETPQSVDFQETSEAESSEIFENLPFESKYAFGIAGNPLYPLAIPDNELIEMKALENRSDGEEVSTVIDSDRDSEKSHASFENDKDNDEPLERSFEVPVSSFYPVFTEDESLEQISQYLQERLKTLNHKLRHIESRMRLEVIDLRRKMANHKRVQQEIWQSNKKDSSGRIKLEA